MAMLRSIYEQYKIMPGLQRHQLRVAAVGKLLCDSFDEPLDARSVIVAGLFHDMGNIIKSDLTVFPEFLVPHDLAYWQQVKDDYIARYGKDEHAATLQILKELGLSESVYRYVDGIGFSALHATRDSLSYEQKICEYADLRVGPRGILTLDERIEDGRVRYAGRHRDVPAHEATFAALRDAAHEIERQIFAHASIHPSDITDASIAPVVEELWEYII